MYASRIIVYELQILRLEIIMERASRRKKVQRQSETKRVHVGAWCSHSNIQISMHANTNINMSSHNLIFNISVEILSIPL